jgi:hypothetical protein
VLLRARGGVGEELLPDEVPVLLWRVEVLVDVLCGERGEA